MGGNIILELGVFLLALKLTPSSSLGKDSGCSIAYVSIASKLRKQNKESTPEYCRFNYAKKYPVLSWICKWYVLPLLTRIDFELWVEQRTFCLANIDYHHSKI